MRQGLSNGTDDIDWSGPIQISALNGETGKDGSDIKYIYYRSDAPITDWTGKGPNANGGFGYLETLSNDWTPSPQGVTKEQPYEYVSIATKPAGIDVDWRDFSNPPVIWSKWGEKGQDGDGIVYHYYLHQGQSQPGTAPNYSSETKDDWTDDPQGVSANARYEYVFMQKKVSQENGSYKYEPESGAGSLWAKWSEDGTSITTKSTEYAVNDSATAQPTDWKDYDSIKEDIAPGKFLWTRITYSDNSKSFSVAYQGTDGNASENLQKEADISVVGGELTSNYLRYTVSGSTFTTGIGLGHIFEDKKQYVISYYYKMKNFSIPDGEIISIGGHSYSFEISKVEIDDSERDNNYLGGIQVSNDCDPHFVKIYAKYNANTELTLDDGTKVTDPTPTLYIQPLRSLKGKQVSAEFEVWNIMVTEGEEYIPWTPAPEDAAKVGQLSGENLIKKASHKVGSDAEKKDYFVIGEAPPEYSGCTVSITSEDVLQIVATNINAEEFHYRFIKPGEGSNELFSVEAGCTYVFRGFVRGETTGGMTISPHVAIRHEEKKDKNGPWLNDTRTTILKGNSSATWIPFQETFIVSKDAVGFYLSFQIYHNNSYSGTFEFKDLHLEKKIGITSLSEEVKSLHEQVKGLTYAGDSIAIYDRSKKENLQLSDFSLLAGRTIEGGKIKEGYANAVYLAGWNVDTNSLWYDGTSSNSPSFNNIGNQNTFGIYPKGITSGLNSAFKHSITDDAWVMTAGDSFGITKKGNMFASAGKVGGWEITDDGIIKQNGTDCFGLNSSSISYNSYVSNGMSPIRFFSGGSLFFGGISYHDEPLSFQIGENLFIEHADFKPDFMDANITASYHLSTGDLCFFDNVTLSQSIYKKGDYILLNSPTNGKRIVQVTSTSSKFTILEDGSLYASAVNLTGKIIANDGRIGAFKLEQQGLISSYISLTPTEIAFPTQTKMKIGQKDVTISRENGDYGDAVYFTTNGKVPFVIKNEQCFLF